MELSIDTVGEQSSVAVSDHGRVLTEICWQSGRRHTPSLTPMIDFVCRQTGNTEIVKQQLEAVFVDVGPGAYGGIRSGMAAAAGLAVALDLQCVGVGRLELEAYQHVSSGLAAAIHRASRSTWAWQIYWGPLDRWSALGPPKTGADFELLRALGDARRLVGRPGVICGEPDRLSDETAASALDADWALSPSSLNLRRAGILAQLGWRRLQDGQGVPPAALEPLYLREPAIGPQPQHPG
jgi:tRNA threonylcarbamoyl adenosine modification protein YeaZ